MRFRRAICPAQFARPATIGRDAHIQPFISQKSSSDESPTHMFFQPAGFRRTEGHSAGVLLLAEYAWITVGTAHGASMRPLARLGNVADLR
jgi:hypothetical protein